MDYFENVSIKTKAYSEPLSEEEFHAIQHLTERGRFSANLREGCVLPRTREARHAYVKKLMGLNVETRGAPDLLQKR